MSSNLSCSVFSTQKKKHSVSEYLQIVQSEMFVRAEKSQLMSSPPSHPSRFRTSIMLKASAHRWNISPHIGQLLNVPLILSTSPGWLIDAGRLFVESHLTKGHRSASTTRSQIIWFSLSFSTGLSLAGALIKHLHAGIHLLQSCVVFLCSSTFKCKWDASGHAPSGSVLSHSE